ncbi:MAG: hypothetical protein ACI9TH_003037 [Kiritimatiellia bacterium]
MEKVTFDAKTNKATLTMKGDAETSKEACETAFKGSTYGVKTFEQKKADS